MSLILEDFRKDEYKILLIHKPKKYSFEIWVRNPKNQAYKHYMYTVTIDDAYTYTLDERVFPNTSLSVSALPTDKVQIREYARPLPWYYILLPGCR